MRFSQAHGDLQITHSVSWFANFWH